MILIAADKFSTVGVLNLGLLAGLYDSRENRLYPPAGDRYTSDAGGYLRAVYDYRMLADTHDVEAAFSDWDSRGMRAYVDLLPLERPENIPDSLGPTPCFSIPSDCGRIFVKREGAQLPGSSTLARGTGLVSGLAAEENFPGLVFFTREPEVLVGVLGDLGDSGLEILLVTPANLEFNRSQLDSVENLSIEEVKTEDSRPYEVAVEKARKLGWCLYIPGHNPYTREAYKSIAFEIYLQRGEIPEKLYVVPGEGDVLSGLWKGFRELNHTEWVREAPEVYAVIPPGASADIRWLEQAEKGEVEPGAGGEDGPGRGMLDLYFAVRAIKNSNGGIVNPGRARQRQAREQLSGSGYLTADSSDTTAALYAAAVSDLESGGSEVVLLDRGEGTALGN